MHAGLTLDLRTKNFGRSIKKIDRCTTRVQR